MNRSAGVRDKIPLLSNILLTSLVLAVVMPRYDLISTCPVSGTGLGLCIVKNIIETHGGRCWFAGQAGKGTTIHCFSPSFESADA